MARAHRTLVLSATQRICRTPLGFACGAYRVIMRTTTRGRYVSHLRCLEFLSPPFPSPSGLGYVLSRLRRSSFLALVLEPSRAISQLTIGNAAPEARKTAAQCGSTGYTT